MDPFGGALTDQIESAKPIVVGSTRVTKIKRIADGGFGSVDLVRDTASGEMMVLKTMMVMVSETNCNLCGYGKRGLA